MTRVCVTSTNRINTVTIDIYFDIFLHEFAGTNRAHEKGATAHSSQFIAIQHEQPLIPTMSSGKQQKEPVPDVPHLRSVLIRSPSSFGVPAPRALSEPKAPPPVISTLEQNKNGPWKIENLLPLPEVYPLERTHVYIDALDVQNVAEKIAECLRKESIAAVFDNNKVRLNLCKRDSYGLHLRIR